MGRANSSQKGGKNRGLFQPKRRERPTRHQAPPPTLNVDVHGVLFVIIAVVFVVYPLAQWALGQ